MNFKDILPANLPFGKKEEASEKYFALDIGLKEVTATLWFLAGKHLQIENISTVTFDDPDHLIDASNQALDDVLGVGSVEPTKILFGVPDNWLQDENLKSEYLEVLKKLVKELDLSPMAYVSTTHAITHMIQKQTGVPPTIILVEITDPLSITIVKAGKIIGTKILKRGDDLPKDIEKALGGFSGIEVLPSKIGIFSHDPVSLEKYKEELTGFNWMGSLPFLHLPKVEILDEDSAIKAVALAGASEFEPDVIFSSKNTLPKNELKPSLIHQNIESPTKVDEDLVENAGFVAGDIEEVVAEDKESPIEEEYAPGVTPQVPMRSEGSLIEEYERPPQIGSPNILESKLSSFLTLLHSKGIKTLLIPLLVVLLLAVGYILVPKAKVTIFIDPKILEKDAQVIADPSVSVADGSKMVIPGKIVETDSTGADKGSATGTKQIGNHAKGAVVIINGSDKPISLKAGTLLTSAKNIKYTLDNDVSNIASKSASLEPGKSDPISVTASDIGPDSNLSTQGDNLSVDGFSKGDAVAQISTAISGGTTQNVTVVTSDDQKKLLAQVDEALRKKAQGELQSKLSGDQKILSEALEEKINSQVYSKKVGDQASDFTLNLSVHYKGTAYSDNDLKQMVAKLVQTNIPSGYILNLQDTQTQADVSKLESNGKLIFLARFQAKLMPKLNIDQIKEDIKGKTPDQAGEVLRKIENVIDVSIDISPHIPDKIARLPFFSKNISINVTAK